MGCCAKGNCSADNDTDALLGLTLSSGEELAEEYFGDMTDDVVDDGEDELSPDGRTIAPLVISVFSNKKLNESLESILLVSEL
jgi:hypothetical protein